MPVRRTVLLTLAAAVVAVPTAARSAPARFEPVSFTAVSDSDYWILGRIACRAGRCFAIERTTDGGRTFARVSAPALPTEGTTPTLRFADLHDGFAYVPWAAAIYATHDGGATWRRLALGEVLAFASGGGYAYAVTARCTRRGCADVRFRRSPASADAWTAAPLPFATDGSPFGLAAHATTVWLLGTQAGNLGAHPDVLARSSDGGRTFVTGPGPCYAGLGGDLEPVSTRVVWTVCPTGMMAAAYRSTDGGIRFRPLKTPPLVNSSILAPTSATTAVLARNGARSPLLRTTDGGRTWTRPATPRTPLDTAWVGFTDARTGTAIVQTGPTKQALWRTTDGGARWTAVPLP